MITDYLRSAMSEHGEQPHMPEPQDPDSNQGEDGSVGNSTIQQMRKQIKELENQAKASQAAVEAAQAAAAEKDALLAGYTRSAAFDRLNIPPTGAGKLFRDTYQGDVADDAILAKAAEYGIVQAPQQTTEPTIPGIDAEAWSRMQQSLSGTASSTPQTALETINGAKDTHSLREKLRDLGVLDSTQ